MVIINPGNPTGQCLSTTNLQEILRYCYHEKLVLLGDEVYQQNIYQDERPFISAKKVEVVQNYMSTLFFVRICYLIQVKWLFYLILKVLMDMGAPFSKEVQLVSFHTVSKGYWGECGQRGGYFEMTNIPPKVYTFYIE